MKLSDLFETPREVQWVVPRSSRREIEDGAEIVVWVDPIKIDAAWKTDSNFYIGPHGTNNAIGNRYNNFGEWLKQGIPVEMSQVYLGDNGIPFFGNGRHRFRWMLDHGATAIPVITGSDRAKEFHEKFGTSNHKTVLTEDAEKDLYHNKRAVEILEAFKKWLKSKDVKVKDIMTPSRLHNGMLYTVPVRDFMGGAYNNLRMGFAYEHNPEHDGFQTVGTENGSKVYIVCKVFDFDIADGTLSRMPVNDEVFIHELIHYLDRMRQRNKDGSLKFIKGTPLGKSGYHSDPLEFNAYFQQGMHKVMNALKSEKIGSYKDFRDKYLNYFNYWGFISKLTPEYKQKFERRFYKLYEFLLNKNVDKNL